MFAILFFLIVILLVMALGHFMVVNEEPKKHGYESLTGSPERKGAHLMKEEQRRIYLDREDQLDN